MARIEKDLPFKFEYRKRDSEAIKKMAAEKGQRYETPWKPGFDVYEAKEGSCNIRILPPTWPPGVQTPEHYGFWVYVHAWVGPERSTFLCLNKMGKGPCPCCEAWREANKQNDKEEIRKWSFSRKVVYWIIDREGEEDQPLLYMISKTRDTEIIEQSIDPQNGALLPIDHENEGYDVFFKRTGKELNTKYVGTKVARAPSPINEDQRIQDKVLKFITENPITSVLKYHDYAYIQATISGTLETKDEDLNTNTEELTQESSIDDENPRQARQTADRTRQNITANRTRQNTQNTTEDETPWEGDEAPRRRRATQEDDDEPPRRRRAEVDEDDERPRQRR